MALSQSVLAGDGLGALGLGEDSAVTVSAPADSLVPTAGLLRQKRQPPPAGLASRQAKRPSVAFSQYLKTTRTRTLERMGCGEGRRLSRSKQGSAIVVLAFGRPMRQHGAPGASLFGTRFASTGDIGRAARAYAAGYSRCSSDGPRLHLAIGTSNYGQGVTFRHGVAWARMVNAANDWARERGLRGAVEFAGANDIELSWNGPVRSKSWVRGYDSVAEWPYFDYGDAAGCPPKGNCAGAWTQEDVWFVAWGARSAWPLPQIYTPTGSMAQEWYRLSLYSYKRHGWRMTMAGALSQHAACRQSSDPCWGMNNAPMKAWRQLHDLLNADPRTAQQLQWISDFRWADAR